MDVDWRSTNGIGATAEGFDAAPTNWKMEYPAALQESYCHLDLNCYIFPHVRICMYVFLESRHFFPVCMKAFAKSSTICVEVGGLLT